MRVYSKLFVTIAIVFAVATLAFAQEPQWFDMEKCAMCKHLTTHEGLLENMTWEHHNISNGIISVTTAKKEYIPALREAQAKMEAVGKKMEKGEQLPKCGMCMAIGELMMKGAKWECVKTLHGDVCLVTSDDPELVAKIQEWAKRTMAEMKKMEMKHEHKEGKEHKKG
ncbi:MAG: hypothetical protein GTO51_05330 [Candidatus Latescibacteria bacterium]|nr:hypothetical protein [Candidatus Latescibacterota bacterium]NIO28425.1 hypothetical protein [Candidatus Latescibacterota bacterium]NIO55974.1 hypothetical protein [Candidatus Latescibacterota bacterium]NIT01938.1 hypothetical protein [Candidatus Latescibacterota bacterium]